MGWPDAQGEPGAVHSVSDRCDPVGLEQRVARIGLENSSAQLDRRGLPTSDRYRYQRVPGHDAGVPQGGEAIGFSLLRLLHDLVDSASSASQSDPHESCSAHLSSPKGWKRTPSKAHPPANYYTIV